MAGRAGGAGAAAVGADGITEESLGNARFEVMSSHSLALADESVDAVISRFGLMMFGDVRASAGEIARVLRRGGHFSLAVWDDLTQNTMVHAMTVVLRDHLPRAYQSLMSSMNELAAEGLRARLLEDAGLGTVRSDLGIAPLSR